MREGGRQTSIWMRANVDCGNCSRACRATTGTGRESRHRKENHPQWMNTKPFKLPAALIVIRLQASIKGEHLRPTRSAILSTGVIIAAAAPTRRGAKNRPPSRKNGEINIPFTSTVRHQATPSRNVVSRLPSSRWHFNIQVKISTPIEACPL